jgi:CheY-like chemotaxis protein
MANIRLIHWNATEAARQIEFLRAAGHSVAYDENINPAMGRRIRETQPDAVVIDLSRLPSHGREVAVYLRGQKSTRDLPLVFVGGAEDKVAAIRGLLPDATYTTAGKLKSAIRSAIKNRPATPVVPPQMMERYALRTSAQKLGVKPETAVAVFDAPRGYAQILGPLPAGAMLVEEPPDPCAVTIWFAHDPETFLAALPRMQRIASKTKLWVAWKKKSAAPTSRLSDEFVRNSAIAAGLVDYKVCAIDATWSGLALAAKRDRTTMRISP